jgi:hypothetical protein
MRLISNYRPVRFQKYAVPVQKENLGLVDLWHEISSKIILQFTDFISKKFRYGDLLKKHKAK